MDTPLISTWPAFLFQDEKSRITVTKKLLGCLFAAGVLFIALLVFSAPNIFDAYSDRQCRRSIQDQIKLPNGWQVEQCEVGDWSGDFDAVVSVPAEQSSKQSIDEFRRLNSTASPDVTISAENALISDDERRLSIEKDKRSTFSISLVGPK